MAETTEHVVKITADTEGVSESLDRASQNMTRLEAVAKRVSDKISSFWKSTTEDIDASAEALTEEIRAVSGVSFDDKALKSLQSEVDKTARRLDSLYARADKMKYLGADESSKSFRSLQYDIDVTQDKMAGLSEQLETKLNEAITSTTDALKRLEQVKTPTQDFQDLTKSLEKAESQLLKLYDKQDKMNEMSELGINTTSRAYHNLQYDIANAELEVERLERAMESMKARGTAFVAPTATADYTETAAQLENYQMRLDQVQERNASAFSRMSGDAGNSSQAIRAALSAIAGGFSSVNKTVDKAVGQFKKFVKQSFNVDKMTKKMTKSLTSFFTMLRGRLKRMAMSAIFADMTQAFNSLAKQSPRFNKAVSAMLDSSKALGAQMVAAIEPIVSLLGPYIAKIIDQLTAGAAAVSQFIAQLAGDSTFFKATKGQSDYAKSLDKTEKNTKKATAAAKKYKAALLGFDQLNKLADDSDDSALGIDSATLDEAYVSSNALNDIAKNIHDAAAAGDFVGVGKAIAEGLGLITQGLADMVGWSKNKDTITDTLNNISDVINGFSAGLIEHGYSIGQNIADIGNSFVEGAAVLLDRVSALDLGAGIGQVLKGSIDGFHWQTLGEDIINGIEFALDFVSGLFDSGFMGSLGKALSDAIHGMIQALDPEKWAHAITSVVNGIFEFFGSVEISIEDFKALGDKIIKFITDTLDGLDWQKIQDGIGAILSLLINGVVGLLQSLVQAAFDPDLWISLGKTIYNAVMTVFVTVVNGLIDAFNGVIETINSIGAFQAPDLGFGGMNGQMVEFVHIDLVPHITPPRLATGGIIKGDGQLFIANEAGPELVGTDGRGNTAVMNNDQLIQAVSQGVRAAVVEAGTLIADRLAERDGDGGDIIIEVDSVELARAANRGNKKIGRRGNHNIAFG